MVSQPAPPGPCHFPSIRSFVANSPEKPVPFAALVPTTPLPDCFSVTVEVVLPFAPVCSTVQVPVMFGICWAKLAATDVEISASPQQIEITRRFIVFLSYSIDAGFSSLCPRHGAARKQAYIRQA